MFHVYIFLLILFSKSPPVYCEVVNISPTCSPDERINGECQTNSSPTCSPDERINGYCKTEKKSATTNITSIDSMHDEQSATLLNKNEKSKIQEIIKPWEIPMLSPSDLPPPQIFTNWDPPTNATISLPYQKHQIIAKGKIRQSSKSQNSNHDESFSPHFSVLPQVIPRETVAEIISILRYGNVSTSVLLDEMYDGKPAVSLDTDPDSVDAMISQEFVLDSPDLSKGLPSKSTLTVDEDHKGLRASIRKKVVERLDPILEGIITPFVRRQYPEQCQKGNGRDCTACYSMIRRYRVGERISHATHHDSHSLVTVVVSLSNYNHEYTGGLYVTTEKGDDRFIALNRGDAIVHQSDLFHGVHVMKNLDDETNSKIPERWSWILWYRDSESCGEMNRLGWFESCAAKGNPSCMALNGHYDTPEKQIYWAERACEGGHATTCTKLARVYLSLVHKDECPYDPMKAQNLYERAVTLSEEPDAYYGLAYMMLEYASMYSNGGGSFQGEPENVVKGDDTRVRKAITYLEAAAKSGHAFAMFNLGIVHAYGYGYSNGTKNMPLAGEWFETSGTPEGFMARAYYYHEIGQLQKANELSEQATLLGFGKAWRKANRDFSAHHGANGLNLPWPSLWQYGNKPPAW